MKKDDDIVKAVGWVTIQASHLENKIEEMAIFISPGFNRPKNHERRFVSQKIKWIEEKIEELNDPTLNPLSVDLKKASCLLEERNR